MNEAFRLLFDQVKSGVVWVQRDGLVRYANKAAFQMTPVALGQPMQDPVAEQTVKAAGQEMLKLPFSFELTTQEAHPDTIRATVINAPVGHDLMVVLNNVSQERWYARALGNLMAYVDTELAQPIEALARRLPRTAQLVQQQGAAGELTLMVEEAEALSIKLGKLHELVSVFGDSAWQSDERVMLPALLLQAMAEVMPQARARNITVSMAEVDSALPVVHVHAHWLRKALSAYLEQAVRSAQPGGQIELLAQCVGARVLVHARLRGLFVSGHERRNAFVPFGAGDRGGPGDRRRGIGLALAQRILEQHGGSVRIEDDVSGVDFVLDLPVGAPVPPGSRGMQAGTKESTG